MKMKHLWRNEIRQAIEDEYRDSMVMEAFRAPCLNLAKMSKSFALSKEELFYYCFFSVDILLGMKAEEAEKRCAYIGDELYEHFEEKWADAADGRAAADTDAADIRLAVTTVLMAVAEVLIRINPAAYTKVTQLIAQCLCRDDVNLCIKVKNEFREGFGNTDETATDERLVTYSKNHESVSSAIEEIMDAAQAKPISLMDTKSKMTVEKMYVNTGGGPVITGGNFETGVQFNAYKQIASK